MKKVVAAACFIFFFLIACSKEEPAKIDAIQETRPSYDTVAIDSFSPGATSVDIARQIRMSSQKYQDSLKEVLKLQQEEKRIQEEVEKEAKKMKEEEKKLKAKENTAPAEPSTH